jgi:iron complex transport system substrate-binding protein
VDLESVVERQPQVIVAATGHGSGGKAPVDWVKSEPRLEDTEALEQNKVSEIDADIASRPGPRIVDAVEDMLRLIHPDLAAKLEK